MQPLIAWTCRPQPHHVKLTPGQTGSTAPAQCSAVLFTFAPQLPRAYALRFLPSFFHSVLQA